MTAEKSLTQLAVANRPPIDSWRLGYGEPYMGGAQPIDRAQLARYLKIARALADIFSDEEVAKRMGELGFETTKWRVNAWMKGESLPRFDEAIGLLTVFAPSLAPHGGFAFFKPCFRPDVYDRFMRLFSDEA